MNSWNIPLEIEKTVIERDKKCVYCGVTFSKGLGSKKNSATWEHIINDARIVTTENIARCCFSCNSSKGAKDLHAWLQSKYCILKGITKETVAIVIKQALNRVTDLATTDEKSHHSSR